MYLPKNDSIEIYFNNEVIRFIHFPGGHSDGDAIVFFTESNVIHMGDLFLTGAFPPVSDIEIYIKILENSWIPESLFIYCIYYKPKI